MEGVAVEVKREHCLFKQVKSGSAATNNIRTYDNRF